MVRLGRWKSGLALLIMLHLLVHPAIHVHRTSGLLGTSTSHSLIRDEADRGVLMICDPRLISKPYGKRIWQSLPAFKRTRELEVALAFFSSP